MGQSVSQTTKPIPRESYEFAANASARKDKRYIETEPVVFEDQYQPYVPVNEELA